MTQTLSISVTLTIDEALHYDGPSALPGAVEGQPYSFDFGQYITGGVEPYDFSTTSTLPDGLTLSVDGVLSGTPTSADEVSLTIVVTDSGSTVAASSPKKGYPAKTYKTSKKK
jgi:hypothetical protein